MTSVRLPVDDPLSWRWRALAWAVAHESSEGGFVAFLNNNEIAYPNDPFPNRLFVGAKRVISLSDRSSSGSTIIQELYEFTRNGRRFWWGI